MSLLRGGVHGDTMLGRVVRVIQQRWHGERLTELSVVFLRGEVGWLNGFRMETKKREVAVDVVSMCVGGDREGCCMVDGRGTTWMALVFQTRLAQSFDTRPPSGCWQ